MNTEYRITAGFNGCFDVLNIDTETTEVFGFRSYGDAEEWINNTMSAPPRQ